MRTKKFLSTSLLPFLFTPLFLAHAAVNPASDNTLISKENRRNIVNPVDSYSFTPPEGWTFTDSEEFPEEVKILVKGKGKYELPPSLNLATEDIDINLKQYLEVVKALHESRDNSHWKKLGAIQTGAGPAVLTQIETKTGWGEIRMLQAILIKRGKAYVLTATAIKDEFPEHYKEFFQAIQSLQITSDPFPGIEGARRQKLEAAVNNLKKAWEELVKKDESSKKKKLTTLEKQTITFESSPFQEKHWSPLVTLLSEEYNDLGAQWQSNLLNSLKEDLYGVR